MLTDATPPREVGPLRMDFGCEGAPILIYVGRISEEKGLALVLAAFKKLLANHNRARLVMIGDGPYMREALQIAEQLGIRHRMTCFGEIRHERLLTEQLFRLGDVFVTGSCTETFGIAPLEAMSQGVPVVGVASHGVGETVRSGLDGALAATPSVDAIAACIETVVGDPAGQRRMSHHARRRAAEFDVRRIAADLEAAYSGVVRIKRGSEVRHAA
jgi:glycogen(starch) synthase